MTYDPKCPHCNHGPGPGGFFLLLLIAAFFVVLMHGFMTDFRWTSIEGGCVVERKFSSAWSANVSEVTQRICPADG